MAVSKTLNGGVTYGMLMSAIIQSFGTINEEAIAALDWYEGEVPEFSSLEDLTAFAVRIYTDYQQAHQPEL
jgi:hypothetical protein